MAQAQRSLTEHERDKLQKELQDALSMNDSLAQEMSALRIDYEKTVQQLELNYSKAVRQLDYKAKVEKEKD